MPVVNKKGKQKMKKLIITALSIGAGIAVQAATYNWSAAPSGATFNGYDSKAAIGSAWSSATKTAGMTWYLICADTISQDDLLTELRGGTDKLSTYKLATGTTTADNTGIAATAFTADSSLVRGDGKMYAYLAIVNADSDAIYLSKTVSQTANTEGGTASIAPAAALATKKLQDADGKAHFTETTAGWYQTSAVPEPTSGLLLLLGVAGLALRRRA